tara:strand:+ start:7218 stop:7598 length:381 start_codon:yes stop_codon:yes gene_type:complete
MLSFWRFSTFLTLLLLIVFSTHTFLTSPAELFLGYIFNYLITIISFLWLLLISKKKRETLGFVFMVISGVKFLFFFLIYKPLSIPATEKKALFLSFYVPYAICSIYEVYILVKLMNQKNTRCKNLN